MAVRGANRKGNKPPRQKPPERPKALRRASLIEVAAANQDAADEGQGALSAMFNETSSPIHRQKEAEKKELEGDEKTPGTASKEFKRCRPIVEMMEHVFTQPVTTEPSPLFGETLFPRVPIDNADPAMPGRRQVRLIKGCEGLTKEAEPGRYEGKTDKKGRQKLSAMKDIETGDGYMTQAQWQEAAEARMLLFRKRLDKGHGPGWASFWEIKDETDEVPHCAAFTPPAAPACDSFFRLLRLAGRRRCAPACSLHCTARSDLSRYSCAAETGRQVD